MSSCVAVSSRARAETYDGPIEWRPNSEELPHRPRSGEVLREKEWGFSYPHSHGGTKSPPSYPPNSGPAGAQRRQPRRRGGQECPPSGGGQVFSEVPHRRASGMIPRETGRGLSIGGAHRVAAVERLVGATLVVALPRTAPPSADHCLGTTEPGGWSGDFLVADWDRRPERRLSGADWDRRPSGRREWRRGATTQPENDATPQGTHKGCPYGHRGGEVTKKSPTAGPPA